jgi:NADH:ubiquinone oxidoreductase subunit E
MASKVLVKICAGTMCYMMGGSQLQLLPEMLPEELADNVDIDGSVCLGYCSDKTKGNPPFVEINGRCMSEANIRKIILEIKKELADGLHQ